MVRLESRPPNIEGRGEVTIRDLVRNALRMRPDRIIVGEVRGGEALDMLQAMNTGHDGSMTTVHANSPRDALKRLETMVMMAGIDLPVRAIREHISSALSLVVHLARFTDGSRRITHITEVTGMEGDLISLQDVFRFEYQAGGEEGRVNGAIRPTGIRPMFADHLAELGVSDPPNDVRPLRCRAAEATGMRPSERSPPRRQALRCWPARSGPVRSGDGELHDRSSRRPLLPQGGGTGHAAPFHGLVPEATVVENGITRSAEVRLLAGEPLQVLLAVDTSGSMAGEPLAAGQGGGPGLCYPAAPYHPGGSAGLCGRGLPRRAPSPRTRRQLWPP